VDGVEAPAVHTLDDDDAPARVGDHDGNGDARLPGLRDSGVGYLLGARVVRRLESAMNIAGF